jgi:hypothetical protein
MTKKLLLLLLLVAIGVTTAQATIRRVGFIATVERIDGFDFTTFQAAHDASVNGDTIQLYPTTSGSVSYSGTIAKRLVVLGPGYFYNVFQTTGSEITNSNLQNLAGNIQSVSLTMNLGSAGTILMGLNNLTVNVVNRQEALNNITITRCRNVVVNWDNSGILNRWTISQCYGLSIAQTGPSAGFTSDRTIDSLDIYNCLINGPINLNTSPSGTYVGNRIYNCVLISGTNLALNNAAFLVQNCIFEIPTSSLSGLTNTRFIRNFTTAASASNGINNTAPNSGNAFSQVLNNIFVNYPTMGTTGGINNSSLDGRFRLRPTATTAINGGLSVLDNTTPVDIGMYGGATPYILSGIPSIPIFYQLGAASAVTVGSTYTVTFSVRNNN